MKYYLLGLLCLPCLVFSQILTLSGGSSITIENTASINLDGLTLAPNSTYDILDNIISLSASPVEVNTNSSIDRVYNTSNTLEGYSGTLVFAYEEDELNDIARVTSLFSRLTYDFDEKYLLTAIFRRDGSSRFGSNNKFGFFPSFSAGWVPSREEFWNDNDIVNQLKIRGGFGVTGNDNIGDFQYLSTISGGRNYTIGICPVNESVV